MFVFLELFSESVDCLWVVVREYTHSQTAHHHKHDCLHHFASFYDSINLLLNCFQYEYPLHAAVCRFATIIFISDVIFGYMRTVTLSSWLCNDDFYSVVTVLRLIVAFRNDSYWSSKTSFEVSSFNHILLEYRIAR